MAGINATQIKDSLGAYERTNSTEIRNMLTQSSVTSGYLTPVYSVRGKFPAMTAVTGHIIQGFTNSWTAVGETTFRANELQNYQQKINYPVDTTSVVNSYIGHLRKAKMKPTDQPIGQYIIEQQVSPRIAGDRETLLCTATYDSTKLGQFGFSMNGLVPQITAGLTSATHPMYQVPIVAPSATNIVDQVNTFEQGIPEQVSKFVDKIYMSAVNKMKYRLDFVNKYGPNNDYAGVTTKTLLGNREIVGLPGLDGTNIIFTTPDTNFLHLLEADGDDALKDVQVLDYTVKLYFDWWEGISFWCNQLVIVAVPAGSRLGLFADNALFYGKDAVVTT